MANWEMTESRSSQHEGLGSLSPGELVIPLPPWAAVWAHGGKQRARDLQHAKAELRGLDENLDDNSSSGSCQNTSHTLRLAISVQIGQGEREETGQACVICAGVLQKHSICTLVPAAVSFHHPGQMLGMASLIPCSVFMQASVTIFSMRYSCLYKDCFITSLEMLNSFF